MAITLTIACKPRDQAPSLKKRPRRTRGLMIRSAIQCPRMRQRKARNGEGRNESGTNRARIDDMLHGSARASKCGDQGNRSPPDQVRLTVFVCKARSVSMNATPTTSHDRSQAPTDPYSAYSLIVFSKTRSLRATSILSSPTSQDQSASGGSTAPATACACPRSARARPRHRAAH